MALDKNLFTLNLQPSKIDPDAFDLIDPVGSVHYRKRSVPNEAGTYCISLSEPLSESILAIAAAPAATTKEKVIELYNPSALVNLTCKGTLALKWVFTWEQHTFEWKRESCYMIRKPDPPVLVAVTKEVANKPTTIQILDYNLNRFDIDDRKGFEIVLLISMLTFGDMEQIRAKSNEATATLPNPATGAAPPPPPLPKPEGWTEDQIAVLQAQEQHDVNEVIVGEQGSVDDYVKYCISLLNDDTLLFITLRSLTSSCVAKLVQVAEATKRKRYKDCGYDDDQELHQYIDTSAGEKNKGKGKGPRVINLDDNPARASTYQPPNTLTIHLSKIAMPELEPKANKPKSYINPSGGSGTELHRSSKFGKGQSSAAVMASLAPSTPSQQTSKATLSNRTYATRNAPTPSTRKAQPSLSSSALYQPTASSSPSQAQLPGHSPRPNQPQLVYSAPFQPSHLQQPRETGAPQLSRPNLTPQVQPPPPQRASGKGGFFSRR